MYIRFFIFIFSISFTLSLSFSGGLNQAYGNDAVVTSFSAEKLQSLIESLKIMKIRRGDDKGGLVELPEIQKDGNKYSVDIGGLLDPIYKEYYGATAQCSGPNCFNFTMLKYTQKGRYVGADEIEAYLSKHCKRINSEDLQPGDVIIFRSADGDVHHSTFYVNNSYAFEKNGPGNNEGGRIMPLAEVVNPRQKAKQSLHFYSCDALAKPELSESEREIENLTSCYLYSKQFFELSSFLAFFDQFQSLLDKIPENTPFSGSIKDQAEAIKLAYYYEHPAKIPQDFDINTKKHRRLLHLASEDKNQKSALEKAAFFLAKGANPNLRDGTLKLPIELTQSHEMIELLLKNGAMIDGIGDVEVTPLMFAFYDDHFDKFKFLIEKGANLTIPKGTDFFEWCERYLSNDPVKKEKGLQALQFAKDFLKKKSEEDKTADPAVP